MDREALLRRMEATVPAVEALLGGLPPQEWRRRPAAGGWSLLEILGHMLSEERDDFRARLRSTLEDPERPWPKLDPEGVVTAQRFQEADPAAVLRELRVERAASLAWLRSLGDARWDAAYRHPRGDLRAGDLLASWAAHDARHLQQIGKRLHDLAAADGEPYSVEYAG